MKKIIVIAACVIFLGVTAVAASAGKGASGRVTDAGCAVCPGMDRQSDNRFCDFWDTLSAERKEQIKMFHQTYIDETAELRIERVTVKGEIRILLQTSSPDVTRLNKLVDDLADLNGEIMEKRIAYILKAVKVAPGLKHIPAFISVTGIPGGCRGLGSGTAPFSSGKYGVGCRK